MNILPKKSWHVRTKRNIERVRRDEALAAEEEKEQQRRVQLAESEARINLLRDQAKLRKSQYPSEVGSVKEQSPSHEDKDEQKRTEHVNFFNDVESAQKSLHGTNADHEKEKKEEQEAYEKKIGLLTYLGQGSAEASGSSSWWSESHEKRMKLLSDAERVSKDTKLKDSMDPLKVFKRFVDAKHGLQENSKKIKKLKELIAKPVMEHSHRHKHKKHKKEPKRLQKSLEELRSERLRREQAEKARAEELLRRIHREKDVKQAPEVVVDERLRGYNSQYNPHLAKK